MTAPGYVPPPVPSLWVKKNNIIFPIPATLTLTGGTPSLATGTTIVKPAGATLALTGGTPLVTRGIVVAPTGASLTLTTGTPRLVSMVHPATGALTLTGGQPIPGYTDNFNRANNATLGAAWTNQLNTMGIESNEAAPMTGSFQYASLNMAVTSNDRRVSVTVGAKVGAGANEDIFIVIAASAAGNSVYASFDNQAALFRIQTRTTWGGGATNWAAVSGSFLTNETLSIERVGTLYTVKKNGAAIGLSWNDSGGIVPIDGSHQLVGIGSSISAGNYRRCDNFLAEYI